MWAEIVGFAATPILTAVAMWWLMRGGDAEAPVEGGALVLRYPRAFAGFGGLIVAFGVVIAAVLWVQSRPDALELVVMALVFGIPGLAFVAVQRRARVSVTVDGIEALSVFGRSRRIAWRDVDRVSFGRLMAALTFRSTDGVTVRASVYLVGIVAQADVVERRLADRGGREAVRDFRAYRQSSGTPEKR